METMTKGRKNMGRVIIPIKIENSIDLADANRGYIKDSERRQIGAEALVDTGAGFVCLNPALIAQLGLSFLKEIKVDTAHGVSMVKVYRDAILTIMDRSCPIDVVEVSSRHQALVGYLALEALDLVVDPKGAKVIPNPEHGDEMIMDLL
jgi:predicted aspartyl protease